MRLLKLDKPVETQKNFGKRNGQKKSNFWKINMEDEEISLWQNMKVVIENEYFQLIYIFLQNLICCSS